MVDATKACESAYIDVDLVKNSPSKKCVIINGGSYVTGKFGERLELTIEMDGKQKKWSPNRDSCQNMKMAFGIDTETWVGKAITLQLVSKAGKIGILATQEVPVMQDKDIP